MSYLYIQYMLFKCAWIPNTLFILNQFTQKLYLRMYFKSYKLCLGYFSEKHAFNYILFFS